MSSTGGKPGGKKLDSLILSMDHLMRPTVGTSKKTTVPAPTPPLVSKLTQENCGSDFLVLSIKHLIKCPAVPECTKAIEKSIDDNYEQRFESIRKSIFKGYVDTDTSMLTPTFSQPIHKNITQLLKLDVKQIVAGSRTAVQNERTNVASIQCEQIEEHTEIKAPEEFLPMETQREEAKTNVPSTNKPMPFVETVETDTEPKKTSTFNVAARALPFSEENYVQVKIISHEINFENYNTSLIAKENITWMPRGAIKHYLTIQGIERRRAEAQGAIYRSFRHDA